MFSNTSGASILVIDDDLDTLGLVRLVLKRAGFEVSTASCWEEVTDRINMALQTGKFFDLVLLDLMMPERSGFDIYHSMEVVLGKMPPVIVLSAKYSMQDMIRASDLGIAKYLVKPTTPDKLLEAVKSVLGQVNVS